LTGEWNWLSREEDDMSPRKPTIDDLDDIDDEDDVLLEEASQETDLDLTVQTAEDAALGGVEPSDDKEKEQR
jgi:hypothetical protein